MPPKAPKVPSALHSGGYNEVTVAKMNKVTVPQKIRCASCKKWKAPPQYSNKQISDLKYKILVYGNAGSRPEIRCRTCTGQQVIEMECIMCDTVKELDGFYKAQRRNPDQAKCIECITKILAVEPGLEEVEGGSDDESEHSNPFSDNRSTLDSYSESGSHQLNSLTLSQYNSETIGFVGSEFNSRRSSIYDDTSSIAESHTKAWNDFASEAGDSEAGASEIADGHVWTAQNAGHQRVGTTYTAYDAHGLPHSRVHVPSSVATDSTRVTRAARSGSEKASASRFAKPTKIPARPPPEKPAPTLEKTGYTVDYSDDDDDDDDYLTL